MGGGVSDSDECEQLMKSSVGSDESGEEEGKTINTSIGDAYGIDPDKPLVAQVGFLGSRYMEWVHIPEVTAEPLRFFGNPVMEALTRTKWWLVPLVWLPIAFWALLRGMHAMAGDGGAGVVGGGRGAGVGVGGGGLCLLW